MKVGPDFCEQLDCLVVGGGPAGLMAGVYLSRFRRSVLILDGGESRAALIPKSQNAPAYPHGISGRALLAQLRKQALRYGVDLRAAHVTALSGRRGDFRIEAGGARLSARTVLLATGVSDAVPLHLVGHGGGRSRFIKSSRIRLCPICDAYELIDQPIFVLGSGEHGAREALYLRTYSAKLVLFLYDEGRDPLPADWRARLHAAEVEIVEQKIDALREVRGGVEVRLASGAARRAKALYAALGVTVHSTLATALGARCDAQGYLEVDRRQQTTVAGLYAAGDVVQSLSQIAVGFGQAAIAASAIHQSLNEQGARRPAKRKRDHARDLEPMRARPAVSS